MNTRLHALADANGRPLGFFMTAGQVSGYAGTAVLLDDLSKTQWLLSDRSYDAHWFGVPCWPMASSPASLNRTSCNEPIRYEEHRYGRRSLIKIMVSRLKNWRRGATRYDRCPTAFFSAVAFAATVIFWL